MSKFSVYKNKIKDVLFANQELLKLIHYPYNNALKLNDIEDVYALLDENIFFKMKNQTFENEARVYLFIYIDIDGNYSFDNIKLTFDVVCHIDLWYLDDEEDRVELITEILENSICNSNLGIGRVKRKRQRNFTINKMYEGKRIHFEFDDFSPNLKGGV